MVINLRAPSACGLLVLVYIIGSYMCDVMIHMIWCDGFLFIVLYSSLYCVVDLLAAILLVL